MTEPSSQPPDIDEISGNSVNPTLVRIIITGPQASADATLRSMCEFECRINSIEPQGVTPQSPWSYIIQDTIRGGLETFAALATFNPDNERLLAIIDIHDYADIDLDTHVIDIATSLPVATHHWALIVYSSYFDQATYKALDKYRHSFKKGTSVVWPAIHLVNKNKPTVPEETMRDHLRSCIRSSLHLFKRGYHV